jgi:hypothetical protein
MLSPEDLYTLYSNNPCTSNLESPYSQLSSSEVFNQVGSNDMGAGTPMNWKRIIHFFKHVKYPCVSDAPGYNNIKGTGAGGLALSFKFLQSLDADAYKEGQPTVRSGTAHSVRNACDLARACNLHVQRDEEQPNGTTKKVDDTKNWSSRMATEYIEHFAHNSLADCLMMVGPDLVSDAIAGHYRAPGYKVSEGESSVASCSGADQDDENGIHLDKALKLPGMGCFISTPRGVAGGAHKCATYPEDDGGPYCDSCPVCPEDPVTGEVMDPCHPCCWNGTIYYYNNCCDNGFTRRLDFSYWVPSDDGSFDGTINGGRIDEILKHVGILTRRNYGGYANFTSQCSGTEPPIILKDMFLKYFQKNNGWNYTTNNINTGEDFTIDRARTISLILKGTGGRYATTVIDKDWMIRRVQDLVFNGYGVLLLSNVGFPNRRDSTGVVYPDRIFYQTYNIIGYDATRTEFNETVYVLHCPFGDWISGGHPSWGDLPPGAFLVTESILRCMIDYYPGADFYGCRKEPCPNGPPDYCDSFTEAERQALNGCGGGYENRCDPYYCSKQQSANGLLFAISLNAGFPKQSLEHSKYSSIRTIKNQIKEANRGV